MTAMFPLEKGLEHTLPHLQHAEKGDGDSGQRARVLRAHSPCGVGRRVSRGIGRLLGAEPGK